VILSRIAQPGGDTIDAFVAVDNRRQWYQRAMEIAFHPMHISPGRILFHQQIRARAQTAPNPATYT
jgi:hypothetical protein